MVVAHLLTVRWGVQFQLGVVYMKILSSCAAAVVLALIFAAPARADSSEFAVSINGSWQLGQFCIGCPPASSNPIVDAFSARFDVYANGTVVPGTMQFTFTDSYLRNFGASPLSFGPPAPCPSDEPGCGVGFSGQVSLPGQQMWSDSEGYFVDFVPPAWPPTGSEGFSATQAVPSTVFGSSVLGIDCEAPGSRACNGMFSCYDIDCATGGDAPASAGYISISPAKTPEPGVLLLLISGALLCFIRRRRVVGAN